MNYQILKLGLGGILLGTALFFAPFLILKVFFFLCIAGFFFRMIRGGGYYGRYRWAHPDHIRSMSDEDYEKYKSYYGRPGCGGRRSETEVQPTTDQQ